MTGYIEKILQTFFVRSQRFEWQTAVSQSARADETHHRQFYPTVNHFISFNSRQRKGTLDRTWEKVKNVPVNFQTRGCRHTFVQSIFYFMSVHIEVILDKNKKQKHTIYTNFPTGLWTIDLTILVITSLLYKMSLHTVVEPRVSGQNILSHGDTVIVGGVRATIVHEPFNTKLQFFWIRCLLSPLSSFKAQLKTHYVFSPPFRNNICLVVGIYRARLRPQFHLVKGEKSKFWISEFCFVF